MKAWPLKGLVVKMSIPLRRFPNHLRGVVPTATLWDTPPANLERCVDEDLDTHAHVALHNNANNEEFGRLTFNLGGRKWGFLFVKLAMWKSGAGTPSLYVMDQDGVYVHEAFGDNAHLIITGSLATEEVRFSPMVLFQGSQLVLSFDYAGGPGTPRVKVYEVMLFQPFVG